MRDGARACTRPLEFRRLLAYDLATANDCPLLYVGAPMSHDDLCTAILKVLRARALRRDLITYSDLGADIGVHHRSPKLHQALGSIWQWCDERDLPHINALVVRKSGVRRGIPGTGYRPGGHPITREAWLAVREEVYARVRRDQLDPPKAWPDPQHKPVQVTWGGSSADVRRALIAAVRSAAAKKAVPGVSAARSQDFLYGDTGLPE